MSNTNRVRQDILDIIYLENLYLSKEEVLGAYDDFIELLKSHPEYDEAYTTLSKAMREETSQMEFSQIQDIMDEVNDDSDEMFSMLANPEYLGVVSLYDESLEKTDFQKLGNVTVDGVNYCVVTLLDRDGTDIEENEAAAFKLNPEIKEVEYVDDKELNEKIFAAFNSK